MRMVNEASLGFDGGFYVRAKPEDVTAEQELAKPGPTRMWSIAHALGMARRPRMCTPSLD